MRILVFSLDDNSKDASGAQTVAGLRDAQGGGNMRFAFFRIFRIFFSHFLGRSLSVMFKRKHSSGIVL